MTEYNIPLRVKLSNKEYDKLKYLKNKSTFVREAINSYYGKTELEVELSKKKILEEIKNEIIMEQDKFEEQILKKGRKHNTNLMNKINRMHLDCTTTIEQIIDVMEKTNIPVEDEESDEEKILKILPTLQGMYHSEKGINYDTLRKVAQDINVDTNVLKDWVDKNSEKLKGDDYKFRSHLCNEASSKIYKDFNKPF